MGCQALEVRVREEQKMMDKKIVAEMDQKVIDQQNTLEKAGVPGFYITTNPQVNAIKYSVSVDRNASESYDRILQNVFLVETCIQQMTAFVFTNCVTGADNADEPPWADS